MDTDRQPRSERCPRCGALSWHGVLCWTRQNIHDYAVVARAFCDGLHRGAWPDRKDGR